MIRLPEPVFSFASTLDHCNAGITGNVSLKNNLLFNRPALQSQSYSYIDLAKSGNIFQLTGLDVPAKDDPKVLPGLFRTDFVKIYENYFVDNEKPARKIYESLLNAAEDLCPFCGGIGRPRNIDHFLPKAKFPQFSVLPYNLIPSCRDCNMDGKGQLYAKLEEHQIIHPYLDNDRFFKEQWIVAEYVGDFGVDSGYFNYFVEAPSGWTAIDKARVANHFSDFEIARRYGTKAGELLGTTLMQIDRLKKRHLSNDEIKEDLIEPGIINAPFVNHWMRGMFQSLYKALG